ncbi:MULTISPECIES: recombinase family protein [Vibrio]|uniref:recombinase family protein n=1 Tax=Vibrio TaxID=662 RepID=UPI001122D290|nr:MULTISPECIES: recombinase family protein [Vibrio]EHU0358684.1 recombinase family protein [Vibrio parahaemolyticus]MCF7455910.1 recombinase family protein [Vibrio sp. A1-1]TOA21089.1 serine recombinase [Vibrio parahaemolyticus]HCE4715405.1 recombinase family protein [Vibrio parahaemolyticus]HCG6024086.1 recombinase family protein [Vibrio parahaemolyticus]
MYIFGYLRASTKEQDASRAKQALIDFARERGHRVAGYYLENESGAILKRPQLMKLLDDAERGDVILIESIDRLSRLDESGWNQLKELLNQKEIRVVSLDLPTSHMCLSPDFDDEFTRVIVRGLNGLLMDVLAVSSRRDYLQRRNRQREGIEKAKAQKRYTGRKPDLKKHEKIYKLRVVNGLTISEVAELTGTSPRTVTRVAKKMKEDLGIA